MPCSDEEWGAIAHEFNEKWNFANFIGAMDGNMCKFKLQQTVAPTSYFNYKGPFSIVLLAVVDADYKFIFVDVGCNGRISDGGVFKNSDLSEALESENIQMKSECQLPGTDVTVPYAMVADDAFPLK